MVLKDLHVANKVKLGKLLHDSIDLENSRSPSRTTQTRKIGRDSVAI